MAKVGDRVGAIMSGDANTIKLFGYGTFAGDAVPPPGVMFMGIDFHEEGIPNPKIDLDSGEAVFGCECWWGPEDAIKAKIGDRKVVMVSITEERQKAIAEQSS